MSDETTDGVGGFEHLLSEVARNVPTQSPYASVTSIDRAGVVDLSFGLPAPSLLPIEGLSSAMTTVIETDAEEALQYGGGRYADLLPNIVHEHLANRGIDVDDLEITNGSSHALDGVCRTFIEPGDSVAVGIPTFTGVLQVFGNHGADIVPVPVDEDGLDVAALERLIDEREYAGKPVPKLVFVIPNFQNPTGATLSVSRRQRLLSLAQRVGCLVVEDDVYGDLRYEGETPPTLTGIDENDRSLHIGSFSKTVAPGVSTGWIAGPEGLVSRIRPMLSPGTPLLTRSILAAYSEDGQLERRLTLVRESYRARRDRMLRALDRHLPPEASWIRPSGGFFVWIQLPDAIDTTPLLERAVENGVVYLPGAMFHPDDSPRSTLRLSFSYVDRQDIDHGVAALGETIRLALDTDA